jgi:hypothetical protein
VFGLFAFGKWMALAFEDAVAIIANHTEHLLGRRYILAPFSGRKDPENEKGKGNQPGPMDGVMKLGIGFGMTREAGLSHFRSRFKLLAQDLMLAVISGNPQLLGFGGLLGHRTSGRLIGFGLLGPRAGSDQNPPLPERRQPAAVPSQV